MSQTYSGEQDYIVLMPWGLTRFQHSGQSHFVTFCCYHRRGLLTTDASRRVFESALERVRGKFRLQVYGYVVIQKHLHYLLLSEPQRDTSGGGTAPLKPKDGLNGPPAQQVAGAFEHLLFAEGQGPCAPAPCLRSPVSLRA